MYREEKRRKDKAKHQATRHAQAKLKASKATIAEARAPQCKAFEEEFHQTLVLGFVLVVENVNLNGRIFFFFSFYVFYLDFGGNVKVISVWVEST